MPPPTKPKSKALDDSWLLGEIEGKPKTVVIPGHGKVDALPLKPLDDAAAEYMRFSKPTQVWYRGDNFTDNQPVVRRNGAMLGLGTYFTDSPAYANRFTGESGALTPVHLREDMRVLDYDDPIVPRWLQFGPRFSDFAKSKGYEAIRAPIGGGNYQINVFDPAQNVSSVFNDAVPPWRSHRIASYPPFDEARARRIADAYEQLKHDPTDPRVRKTYSAMLDETMGQYDALKGKGYEFRFNKPGEGDPYAASPALGYIDMRDKGLLRVFPTDQGFGTLSAIDDHPLLKRVGRVGDLPNGTANDVFRITHDVFGHFAPGNPFFRHKGEERAWLNHRRMYSPEAQAAVAAETRGQNSWLNFGPRGEANRKAGTADTVYGDQKAGMLPEWVWTDFADGGPVGMKTGRRIKDMRKEIGNDYGEEQGRRFEQAADLTNLERFNDEALRRAFDTGDTGLYTVMPPRGFEKFAEPLSAQILASKPYYKHMWGDIVNGVPKSFTAAPSYEAYIRYLQDVTQNVGLSSVPSLDFRHGVPSFGGVAGSPEGPARIVGHEGRHRARTLAEMGDENVFVHLNPGGSYGTPDGRVERLLQRIKADQNNSAIVQPEIYTDYTDPFKQTIRREPQPLFRLFEAGGPVKMKTGRRIKDMQREIGNNYGEEQARRFERAADLTNLERFDDKALRRVFGGSGTGLYTAMPAWEYEKFAAPLGAETLAAKPYHKTMWGNIVDGVPKSFTPAPSYEAFIKYLQDVTQNVGLSEIPKLNIRRDLPPDYWGHPDKRMAGEGPSRITSHEGRHRVRTLGELGDENVFIHMDPGGSYDVLEGRAERLLKRFGANNEISSTLVVPERYQTGHGEYVIRPLQRTPEMWADGGPVKMGEGDLVKVKRGMLSRPSRLKGVRRDILDDYGEEQARRFDQAADLTNLGRFNNDALMNTFNVDTSGLYTVIPPGWFEKLALPLPARKPAGGYDPIYYIDDMTGKTYSFDEYIKHLSDIGRSSGFDQVPYFRYKPDPLLGRITGHEGRHRSRALDLLGDQSMLIELRPRNLDYGVPEGRVERLSGQLPSNRFVVPQRMGFKLDGTRFDDRAPIQLPKLFEAGGPVKLKNGRRPKDAPEQYDMPAREYERKQKRAGMLGPIHRSPFRDHFYALDDNLQNPYADAVTNYVGHGPRAVDIDSDAVGLMFPRALENLGSVPQFAPTRDLLREFYGDRFPLMRVQHPYDETIAKPRTMLSWTSDPAFAEFYAGVKKPQLPYSDAFITEMERMYDKEGIARIGPAHELRRGRQFDGVPDFPEIWRGGDMITDTESVRAYMNDQNERRLGTLLENEAKRGKIKHALVDIDDIIYGTNRAGQSEFIVRNRPEYLDSNYAAGGPVKMKDGGSNLTSKFRGKIKPGLQFDDEPLKELFGDKINAATERVRSNALKVGGEGLVLGDRYGTTPLARGRRDADGRNFVEWPDWAVDFARGQAAKAEPYFAMHNHPVSWDANGKRLSPDVSLDAMQKNAYTSLVYPSAMDLQAMYPGIQHTMIEGMGSPNARVTVSAPFANDPRRATMDAGLSELEFPKTSLSRARDFSRAIGLPPADDAAVSLLANDILSRRFGLPMFMNADAVTGGPRLPMREIWPDLSKHLQRHGVEYQSGGPVKMKDGGGDILRRFKGKFKPGLTFDDDPFKELFGDKISSATKRVRDHTLSTGFEGLVLGDSYGTSPLAQGSIGARGQHTTKWPAWADDFVRSQRQRLTGPEPFFSVHSHPVSWDRNANRFSPDKALEVMKENRAASVFTPSLADLINIVETGPDLHHMRIEGMGSPNARVTLAPSFTEEPAEVANKALLHKMTYGGLPRRSLDLARDFSVANGISLDDRSAYSLMHNDKLSRVSGMPMFINPDAVIGGREGARMPLRELWPDLDRFLQSKDAGFQSGGPVKMKTGKRVKVQPGLQFDDAPVRELFGDKIDAAAENVRRHTLSSGNEGMVLGDRYGTTALVKGGRDSATWPEWFDSFAKAQAGHPAGPEPFFSMHTHPVVWDENGKVMSLAQSKRLMRGRDVTAPFTPSPGDIYHLQTKWPDIHHMMIEAAGSPNARFTMSPPFTKDPLLSATEAQRFLGKYKVPKDVYERAEDFSLANNLSPVDSAVQSLMLNDKMSRASGLPVFMNPDALTGGPRLPMREMWKDLSKYLKRHGAEYQSGGPVKMKKGKRVEVKPGLQFIDGDQFTDVFGDKIDAAAERVRRHTLSTANEGMVLGDRYGTTALSKGKRDGGTWPDWFDSFAKSQFQYPTGPEPFFSLHGHPVMWDEKGKVLPRSRSQQMMRDNEATAPFMPSSSDLLLLEMKWPLLHHMVIESMGTPNARLMLSPGIAKEPVRATMEAQRFGNQFKPSPELLARDLDFNSANKLHPADSAAYALLFNDKMARSSGLPMFMNADAVTGGPRLPMRDLLPEYEKYLTRHKALPNFAKGGAA
jgi:hypothetical protein